MPLYVTPITLALIILSALSLSCLVYLVRVYAYRKSKRLGGIEILRVKGGEKQGVKDIIDAVGVPLTLEIAVHQLGNDVNTYIIVPPRRVKMAEGALSVERADGYDMYHSGGVQLGAYMKEGGNLQSLDAGKIDFSKVNEIGEGAVVQFIFKKKRGKTFVANGRILVSAPSTYQANEILVGIKGSLRNFKTVDVRNRSFLRKVYMREFDEADAISLEA